MASIHSFRALRPVPASAPAVSSVPYDVVSTEEARQLASGNPLSFLHVTRSEIDLPEDTDPYSRQVYVKARANFELLRASAPLVVDESPSLYLYRLRMGAHEQTGLAGCFSIDEYESDLIKKHERTRRDKEDDRTRHIVELRAQTGVVFLTYKAVPAVDAVERQVTAGQPLYDFTADDGVHHTVWRAGTEQARALVAEFEQIPALYIADGHHRAASAARARTELRQLAGSSADAGTFIAVAFPDNQMQVLPYNRTVKDLAGRSPEQFLQQLGEVVPVSDGDAAPRAKGDVRMYLAGKWYALDFSGAMKPDASRASFLDVALLQRTVLEGLLGIGDVRSDKRIDFIGGARGTTALEAAVDSGKAAIAFSMFPVTLDDLMAISDAGGIMPPKSTWFEPKLRDGLLIHAI
ncbi:MAG: DUF1015 domain-containing protein [Acidobacteria bacterium]|nr:DUF1015 domain-containing protein [Acidobacteriota bacterium]